MGQRPSYTVDSESDEWFDLIFYSSQFPPTLTEKNDLVFFFLSFVRVIVSRAHECSFCSAWPFVLFCVLV